MDELGVVGLPALHIARLVRERRVAPEEVVRAHLERIGRVEPAIRAFQLVDGESALAEAARLGNGDLDELPLAGVPVAVKDNVAVAGLPTRRGSDATSTAAESADDELVRRLRAAGCVVLGKSQLPELAIWPFTEPSSFDWTANPWDQTRTPGGSTGGGAAALAAGMVALALGSDGGGSIRIPAACCGVFGLKPGPGIVPLESGRGQHWYGLSEFGPLARTVADAAVLLDVLAGTHRYRDPAPADRSLRIAFSTQHPVLGARPDPVTRDTLDGVVRLLRECGHTVVRADPPYDPGLPARFSTRWLAGIAEDAAGLPADRLEPRTRAMARLGRRLATWTRPAAADRFARRVGEWFAGFDALLTPTLTRPAVPIGSWERAGWLRTALGVGNWLNTLAWNLAGLPAASLPCGTAGRLPVAVQLVASRGGESTILSLAVQIERCRPWPQLAPLE